MADKRLKVRDVDTGQTMSAKAFKDVTRAEIESSHVPLAEAARALGMSTKPLRGWCERNEVSHLKYRGRWRVHKEELFAALRQE